MIGDIDPAISLGSDAAVDLLAEADKRLRVYVRGVYLTGELTIIDGSFDPAPGSDATSTH